MNLINIYKKLPPEEKTIVDILVVAGMAISRTNLALCLNKRRFRNDQGKPYKPKELDPFLQKLLPTGLIKKDDIRLRVEPTLVEPICGLLDAADEFKSMAATVRAVMPLDGRPTPFYIHHPELLIREVRMGVYEKNFTDLCKVIEENHNLISQQMQLPRPYAVIHKIFADWQWLRQKLPREVLARVIQDQLETIEYDFAPVNPEIFELLAQLEKEMGKAGDTDERTAILFAQQHLLKGELKPADKLLKPLEGTEALTLKGFSAFLAGKTDAAIAIYEEALVRLKQSTRRKKIYFQNTAGLFFVLALLRSGLPKNRERARSLAQTAANDHQIRFANTYQHIVWLIDAGNGDGEAADYLKPGSVSEWKEDDFQIFFLILCQYWLNRKLNQSAKDFLKKLTEKSTANGYHWLAMESAELLSRNLRGDKHYRKEAITLRKKNRIKTIVELVDVDEKWKGVLDALIHLNKKKRSAQSEEASVRLAWRFEFSEKQQWWNISPREQRRSAKGIWGKGRPIALKRLSREPDTFKYFTSQDKLICAGLVETYERSWNDYYGEYVYHFNDSALAALVGHPYIFWEDAPDVQVELVKGDPELSILKSKQGEIRLELVHALNFKKDIYLVRETPNRVKMIELNDEIKAVAKIVGNGITVPAGAEEEVKKAIGSVSSVLTVHSEIDGSTTDIEEVSADPRPHFHLMPLGQGLKVDMMVRPFSTDGPYFRPGIGGRTVTAEIHGKRLQTRRDPAREKRLAEEIVARTPTLAAFGDATDGWMEWRLEDPEACLETIVELSQLKDAVVVEWPEGRTFTVKQQADLKQLRLKVKKERDWFNVTGELALDDNLVLSMSQLIKLLDKAPGRFIPLEDGEFLALTKAFRKRLEEIKTYSSGNGQGRRFHPLSTLMIEEMSSDLGRLSGDKHWKAHLKHLKEAREFCPELPSTFRGDLRDYQEEGFNWLARLNHWGVGACLADDMGLGKTIQALALMLVNAPKGPCLVVAPTSVCMNWEMEARRFAPTLNVVFLGNGDRKKMIEHLKPFDLLVVSYGLLQQQETAELIGKAAFETIVLDEAQAIKNFTTKRSQAAMNLNGRFKLITTGTPIENSLAELWNLFRFINPGLLGSLEAFNRNYALPIEKEQAKEPRRRLKRLIQPFILRRTKNQVLEELPPRTEITLAVELSKEEMAFYEALRLRALTKLAEDDSPASQKHLKILAEIMRLRRACCSPGLVDKSITISSAKLAAFNEVVEELLAGGHKALVFSQFVGHLALIKNQVERRNISYQYLDGGTPAKERRRRVEAFQAGKGDLFLISLKAGGLGLNLTAADYVIHMDPWWNPAVEDQAADRAHRIGQQRPVTVYRIMAQNTIEEKIVALHRTKRDLADGLLKGADMSGKMSAEALLNLIQESN